MKHADHFVYLIAAPSPDPAERELLAVARDLEAASGSADWRLVVSSLAEFEAEAEAEAAEPFALAA
jgi:hypothetical protein